MSHSLAVRHLLLPFGSWVLGLGLTRDGNTTRLSAAIGNPSTVGYWPTGTVAYGDASRELHWVGELQEGDVVTLQYYVQNNGTTPTAQFMVGSNRNGGHRLTTVFLRA